LSKTKKQALQRVNDVQSDVEHKQSELQIIRQREIHTVQRARYAQEVADQKEAALQTAVNAQQQQQLQIDQIRQAAKHETAQAQIARKQAIQRENNAQAL